MGLKIGITCYPTVGGSGIIATELGMLLAERGHEIHFITSSIPYRLNKTHENIYFHEVEVNQYSVFQYPPYDIALASKMAEVIEREELDILHVHYAIPHAICAFLAKEMTKREFKIVTTLHGTDITVLGADLSLKSVIKLGIEKSDVVTAVSKELINQTVNLIEPNKEILPVYNFVDERVYRKVDASELKKKYGIENDEKVIIHISNFRKVKRVEDVVKAYAQIYREIKSKLLLVGDGPELTSVSNLVCQLGLKNHVIMLGNQKNIQELLSISDVKLLLSEKESFGLVLLEAMSCGVPCVGTRIGGIPEVIIDGETGFICELGDIEDIARKTMDILLDQNLHQSMSEQAIHRVHNVFQSEKVVGQYEEIYYRLVGDVNESKI